MGKSVNVIDKLQSNGYIKRVFSDITGKINYWITYNTPRHQPDLFVNYNKIATMTCKMQNILIMGLLNSIEKCLEKIRELAPTIPEAQNSDRWYNSLRDTYIDSRPRFTIYPDVPFNNNSTNSRFAFIDDSIQLFKDYWHIGAIVGSAILVVGGIVYFWDPISTGFNSITSGFSHISSGMGNAIKTSYNSIIEFFSSRRGPGSGGSDDGDNTSIVIMEDSDNTLQARVLNNKLPDVPSTPLNLPDEFNYSVLLQNQIYTGIVVNLLL